MCCHKGTVHEAKSKVMDEELEKIELQIERLKSAIRQTQRKAKILEIDMDEYIDELLELLSATIKEKEKLKKENNKAL